MKPIEFPEKNRNFDGPGCNPLPAYNNGSSTVTCWEMDKEDFARFLDGEKIWVAVLAGESTPPVQVFVGKPSFLINPEKGIDEANGPG